MEDPSAIFSVDWRQRVIRWRGQSLDLKPQYLELYALLAARKALWAEGDDGFVSCEEIQMLASWSGNSTVSVGKKLSMHLKEQEALGQPLIEGIKRASGPYRLSVGSESLFLDPPARELLARLGLADHSTSLSRYQEEVAFEFSELYWNGVWRFDRGELHKAYGCFRRALRKAPTPQLRAAASFYARRILERLGKPKDAIRLRTKHAKDIQKAGRYEGWARARDLTIAAWLAYREERFDEAEGLYREALVTAQRLGLLREIGEVYNGLGEIARKRSEWEQALRHYVNALDAWILADYFWGFQAVYLNLGALYHSWGDSFARIGNQAAAKPKYRLATEWTKRCSTLCQKFGLGDDMAEDHVQLSSLYRKLGRTDLALIQGKKAQEMALRSRNPKSALGATLALIAIHLERDDLDSAQGVFAKTALVLRSALPEALLSQIKKRL